MSNRAEANLLDPAEWVERRIAALTDEACRTIRSRIEVYRTDRPAPFDELRHSININIRLLVSALKHPKAALDPEIPTRTGRRRALQGVPLPEVLHAYRISFATLWDALVGFAREHRNMRMAQNLLTAASNLWQLADEHALALTEAYRAAAAELLVAQQQRRSALVEVLVSGRPSPESSPWEAASLLHLPPEGDLVVVAAQTRSVAHESLPSIEQELEAHSIFSAWRLTPALQIGIVAVGAGGARELVERLRAVATNRTGVSPVFTSPVDAPRALRLARAALASIDADTVEVREFSSSPLAAMMMSEPQEKDRLVTAVLGPVIALAQDERSLLLETLSTYFDVDGSMEEAAVLLHCHANTVRYRLKKIQELTGRSLKKPTELAELATATVAYSHRRRDR